MAVFTLASACCGLAPDPSLLVIARLVQGLGAALMGPQVLAIIQVTFPPRERPSALSVYGAVVGISSLAGQALGGFLIRADLFGLSWRVVFLINIPIGIAALAAATVLLPETRSETARRLDLGGVAIITAGLFLLVFPMVEGRDAGWPTWASVCLIASVPTIAAFVAFERWLTARGGSPLVVLSLFRARSFVSGLGVAFLFGAANQAMFFTLALYLQIGLHFSALAAGLTFAPAPVGFFCAATLSGRLSRRLGGRLIAIALLMKAAAWTAIALFAHRSGASLSGAWLIPFMFVEGAGAGWTNPPLIGAVLTGVPHADAGSASGVLTTFQQISGAIGVAVIGVLFFVALGGSGDRVAATSAPALRQELVAAGLPSATIDRTLADYQACVRDRAHSRDPAVAPASCQQPTLAPGTPAAASAVTGALNAANARTYADAYEAGMYVNVGLLLLCVPLALMLPTPPSRGTP
jgi:MFS family permease